LLLIVPFVIVAMAPQESGSYYVDGVNGNDSNPGTASAPWQTIQKAADTAAGGSVVTVRAGTYNEHVEVTRSGSSGALTTFQAEGTVVMQGFTITANYVRVIGFEITNSNTTYGDGNGVAVQGSFNEIRNNYVHDLIFGEGIWLYGGSNRDASFTSNNIVSGNRIVQARIAGILVEGTNSLIENNDISNTIQNPPGAPPRDNPDADGIRFFGSGHVIRGNYIHNISLADPGNTSPHIDGFQTWGPCTNMVIEQNVVWQAESPDQGMIIEGVVQPVGNIVIRNNVFMTNGAAYAPAVLAGGQGLVSNISIVNNTMVALTGPTEYAIWLLSNLSGASIRNNAIYDHGNSSTPYVRIDTGAAGVDIGFNSISKSDGQPPAGSPYPGDLWMVNPQFVDFAGHDFHLKSGSPLIDVGSLLSIVTNDFDGLLRPFGAVHDIGAFEWSSPF
jgi:parallel beta-helix repeat protein